MDLPNLQQFQDWQNSNGKRIQISDKSSSNGAQSVTLPKYFLHPQLDIHCFLQPHLQH
jgi:hypothetical protein